MFWQSVAECSVNPRMDLDARVQKIETLNVIYI